MPPEMSEYMQSHPIESGRGSVAGRVLLEGKPIHVADVQADLEYTMGDIASRTGSRAHLGVPLLREGTPIGVIILGRKAARPFTDKQIELVTTFADQAVIAIENVRLFDEIQDKSRQLAEASRHKSQFLANMSHELRTPLNAIIGVTEMLREDAQAAQQDVEPLDRVLGAGRHLLALINDVLDLSKIEAGRMELHLESFPLAPLIADVVRTVEPLAARTPTGWRSIASRRRDHACRPDAAAAGAAQPDEQRQQVHGEGDHHGGARGRVARTGATGSRSRSPTPASA